MLLARSYVDAVQGAGGVALMLPPDPAAVRDPDMLLDLIDGLRAGRRRRRGSVGLWRRAAPDDDGHRARARRVRARARGPGDGARHPVPRYLPRHAGDEHRARRHADPAPARRPRPRGPPPLARLVRQLRPRRAPRSRLACRAGGARGAACHEVAPPPGHCARGRGPRGDRLGDDRRPAGGARAARQPLRAGRPVASRGRLDVAVDRRAGRRGTRARAARRRRESGDRAA